MKTLLKIALGIIIFLVVFGILIPIIFPIALVGFAFLGGLLQGIFATPDGWKILAAIGLIILAIFFFYIAFTAD